MNEYRDASDRLSFDLPGIEAIQYQQVTHFLSQHFNLTPMGELIDSLDEIFQDYKLDHFVVGLEWDNWSGYTICAKNTESEGLATQIANLAHEKYESNT